MTSDSLIIAFSAVLALSAIGAWSFAPRSPTIQAFYWGDQRLSLGLVANLLLSNSFSLNGLLYQTWLGYTIGWWSLLVQGVWCLGFGILAWKVARFENLLSNGTLHGIIGSRFGRSATKVAAIASIIGFGVLIGWETVVGATVFREAAVLGTSVYIGLPIILVLIAAFYTGLGGLRGNAFVNLMQNVFKILILLYAIWLLFGMSGATPVAPRPSPRDADFATVLLALGGMTALGANLAFSLFWQSVDMSIWQSLAAAKPKRRLLAILISAVAVFFFPGFFGALIGIGLSDATSITNVTDSNILNRFVEAIAYKPWAAVLLFGSFAAAILSTVDGFALAASQAATWDLLFPERVQALLRKGTNRTAEADDRIILSVGRLCLLLIALVGASALMYLVVAEGVSLFNLVYIVVIGQMSLVGPVLYCLFSKRVTMVRHGSVPIIVSLGAGGVMAAMNVTGAEGALAIAPLVTIGMSLFTTWLIVVLAPQTEPTAATPLGDEPNGV